MKQDWGLRIIISLCSQSSTRANEQAKDPLDFCGSPGTGLKAVKSGKSSNDQLVDSRLEYVRAEAGDTFKYAGWKCGSGAFSGNPTIAAERLLPLPIRAAGMNSVDFVPADVLVVP